MKPLLILIILASTITYSQQQDKPYIKEANQLVTTGLKTYQAYDYLKELSVGIGPRLAGSPNSYKAVDWSKKLMEKLGFENVHTETCMVPHWVRGKKEIATVAKTKNRPAMPLKICALGGSISTPKNGITAEVLEIDSWDQLKNIGDKAKGKILFFNRPMDRTKMHTFEAYGGAVDQRGRGAVEAAKVGGVAALVRSMSTTIDDAPHTGGMGYVDSVKKIPTCAVSTLGAEKLSKLLHTEGTATLTLNFDAQWLPDTISYNVIGEIKGTEHPEEVIVIGGHMDSWDKGRGAHDDGAGIVQSIEAVRLIKECSLHPKRTIRCVMFMNEENGARGGKAYANLPRPGEKPIAAIESDEGGFAPLGFGVSSKDSTVLPKIARWSYLLKPFGADDISAGGGGTDISFLEAKGAVQIGLRPENARYFDYHHSDNDTIDKVNERELELGAAACAILLYAISMEGI